jgi:hypothetical protein
MESTDQLPEQTLEWLETHERGEETPDETIRHVLRGPEPATDDHPTPTNDHVTDAFLEWIRSHGEENESPDETIRKMRRGPKPVRHSMDPPSPEQPNDP